MLALEDPRDAGELLALVRADTIAWGGLLSAVFGKSSSEALRDASRRVRERGGLDGYVWEDDGGGGAVRGLMRACAQLVRDEPDFAAVELTLKRHR